MVEKRAKKIKKKTNILLLIVGPKNLIEFCCKKLDISSIDEYLYNAD